MDIQWEGIITAIEKTPDAGFTVKLDRALWNPNEVLHYIVCDDEKSAVTLWNFLQVLGFDADCIGYEQFEDGKWGIYSVYEKVSNEDISRANASNKSTFAGVISALDEAKFAIVLCNFLMQNRKPAQNFRDLSMEDMPYELTEESAEAIKHAQQTFGNELATLCELKPIKGFSFAPRFVDTIAEKTAEMKAVTVPTKKGEKTIGELFKIVLDAFSKTDSSFYEYVTTGETYAHYAFWNEVPNPPVIDRLLDTFVECEKQFYIGMLGTETTIQQVKNGMGGITIYNLADSMVVFNNQMTAQAFNKSYGIEPSELLTFVGAGWQ